MKANMWADESYQLQISFHVAFSVSFCGLKASLLLSHPWRVSHQSWHYFTTVTRMLPVEHEPRQKKGHLVMIPLPQDDSLDQPFASEHDDETQASQA